MTYVFRGSPARRAGLERGDIITRVDGRPVYSLTAFSEALHDARERILLHVHAHARKDEQRRAGTDEHVGPQARRFAGCFAL